MHKETLEELASARRYAYAAFQRLTGDAPTSELFGSLDPAVLRMAFEVVGALPEAAEKIDEFFRQLASAPGNLEQVADEYARIFVGPAALPAPPWESVYRDKKRLLMTATTLSVREFYRAYGYEAQERSRVPDDHMAIELDFLAALAKESLDASAAGDAEEAKGAIEAGGLFLNAHLALWVADFAADLRERDGSPFYCAVADALCAFAAADRDAGQGFA